MRTPRGTRIINVFLMTVITALLTVLAAISATAELAPATQPLTPDYGEVIGQSTDLAADQWIPVDNATVTLPEPGVYELVQQVCAALEHKPNEISHTLIASRLFNVTDGTQVSDSQLIVFATENRKALDYASSFGSTTTGHAFIEITQPTTVRLDAMLTRFQGSASGRVYNGEEGVTKIIYKKVG
jgi:hypothetical protein